MIPRRVAEHVKAHNWFAVAIDFIIVVLGVYIGIQVSNWNEDRQFHRRERSLLVELRGDIERTNTLTEQRMQFYEQVFASGKRSLAFLEKGEGCGENCWPVLIDFFHASQWTRVDFSHSTFDEMRRVGLPSSRDLVVALDVYYDQNVGMTMVFNDKPAYRSLVRGLIPVTVQEAYWGVCHRWVGGMEELSTTCPPAMPNVLSAAIVARIASHPDILPTLTSWTGFVDVAHSFREQIKAGENAIAIIDRELGPSK